MKVKIGDKTHDANEEPIMLIFDSSEEIKGVIKHLSNMPEENRRYCIYPSEEEWVSNDHAKIKEWMRGV